VLVRKERKCCSIFISKPSQKQAGHAVEDFEKSVSRKNKTR